MTPALLALLIQYGLQYGAPALIEIIKLFKIEQPTLADIEAAFRNSQKRFEEGFEGVLAPGVLQPNTPTVPPAPVPAPAPVPPPAAPVPSAPPAPPA